MSNKTISIYSEALKRHENEEQKNIAQDSTQQDTRIRELFSDIPREN